MDTDPDPDRQALDAEPDPAKNSFTAPYHLRWVKTFYDYLPIQFKGSVGKIQHSFPVCDSNRPDPHRAVLIKLSLD
jgi:hypothetical protein